MSGVSDDESMLPVLRDAARDYVAARQRGLDQIAAIRLIRQTQGLSLIEAKKVSRAAETGLPFGQLDPGMVEDLLKAIDEALEAAEPDLGPRNRRLDYVSTVAGFFGLVAPIFFMHGGRGNSRDLLLLGLGFGLMIDLPVLVIVALTLPSGVPRLVEFWRYYETRHGVGRKSLLMLYALGLLGIVCALLLASGRH
jgi:hypothetical protein